MELFTALFLAFLLTPAVMTSQMLTLKECDKTKSCLTMPESRSGSDCESLVAWSHGGAEDEYNVVSFQFTTSLTTASSTAIAFSEDPMMARAVMIFCTPVGLSSENSSVSLTWANYTSGQRISQLKRNQFSLNARGKIAEGLLDCRFNWPIRSVRTNYFPPLSEYKYIQLVSLQGTSVQLLSKSAIDFTTRKEQVKTFGSRAFRSTSRSVDYSIGCDDTKGCFSDADGAIATFAMTVDGQYLNIEMQTEPGTSNGWIALAFARSTLMGPASVVECVLGANGVDITVQHSFNEATDYENTPIDSRGINIIEALYEEGRISCSFQRPVVIGGNDADPRLYNLTEPYDLQLAKGLTNLGIKLHHSKPPVTSDKVNLNETFVVGKSNGCHECSIRAHGCLMITAWMLLTSIGILLPRYFKASLGTKKIFELVAWFFMHRLLMILTLVVTAAGFVLIFVVKEGHYSKFPAAVPSYFWTHAPLGIIVMILVIVNPIMTIFRCGPTDPNRPIFNWLHFVVGTGVQILAVVNIFFGLKIGEYDGILDHLIFWLMVGYVGFHLVIELILSFSKYVPSTPCDRNSSTSFDLEEKDKKSASKGRALSDVILLGIYVIAVTGLWIAMMILIAWA